MQWEYCLKAGVANVGRHRVMSAATVAVTVACLVLVMSVLMLSQNISVNLKQFQAENAMLAFVDDTLSEREARALQADIESTANVTSVQFITRTEAYKAYATQYEVAEGAASHLEPTVFRDRYVVQLKDQRGVEAAVAAIKKVDGIADIRIDETVSKGFGAVQNLVHIIGGGLVILLMVVATMIMANTIKLTTYSRHEEIEVQKMMGADDSFVRLPFLFEGGIVGTIGAATAFILSWVLYAAVCRLIQGTGVLTLISVLPFTSMAVFLLPVCFMLGLSIGVFGSAIAIRKYLNV